MNTVRQCLVDRAPLSYLGEALSLCVVEASVQRYLRLDARDESIRALVAVFAIVGVHTVELELHVDAR